MHEGTFHDGPLDGLTYTIRSEQGVLVVNDESTLAWLYTADPTKPTPAPDANRDYTLVMDGAADPVTGARVFDEDKALQAVESGYDVVTEPGDEPTQEQLDEEEVITDGD